MARAWPVTNESKTATVCPAAASSAAAIDPM
jgi:hypothetical protein